MLGIVRLALVALSLLLAAPLSAQETSSTPDPRGTHLQAADPATAAFQAVLDDLELRAFRWFQRYRHPVTGLVLDRGPNDAAHRPDPQRPGNASVASVGYFLTLLPVWVERGYLSEDDARRQAEETLRFVVERTAHHRGLLFHFVDWRSGQVWEWPGGTPSEAGVLDHAICANGAMTAAAAFGHPIDTLADELLRRVDWQDFVVADRRTSKPLLSMGWSAGQGLLSGADVRSSEMAMAYYLAVGSPRSIDPSLWYNTRIDERTVGAYRVLNPQHPLFTSMYGLNWHAEGVDRDGVDFFANARQAALWNRAFCRAEGKTHATYREENGLWWGISAGDSPTGYRAAAPLPGDPQGVVWPMAAIASVPWIAPELREDVPRWRNSAAWQTACGPYGLSPFRLGSEAWVAPDLIGIDLGSMAVSIANARSRTIWRLWMSHPVAQSAYERLGIAPLGGGRPSETEGQGGEVAGE